MLAQTSSNVAVKRILSDLSLRANRLSLPVRTHQLAGALQERQGTSEDIQCAHGTLCWRVGKEPVRAVRSAKICDPLTALPKREGGVDPPLERRGKAEAVSSHQPARGMGHPPLDPG